MLRWFFDDTRMTWLARDNKIAVSTAYAYQDEAIAMLAARRPGLHGALLAARTAGHTHVILDGTLIETDRIPTRGPTPGVQALGKVVVIDRNPVRRSRYPGNNMQNR